MEDRTSDVAVAFGRLRSRTLIPWTVVGSVILVVLLLIGRSMPALAVLDADAGGVLVACALYGLLTAWILRACRGAGVDLRRLVGRLPRGYSWLAAVGLLVTAMVFSVGSWFVTTYVMSRYAPALAEALVTLSEPTADSVAIGVAWTVVAVVVAPVVEEVLFRGILVNRWGTKWSLGTGVVASAVCFGALHPAGVAGATAMGLATAFLYLQSGTLIVPIAFHAANNLVATVATGFFLAEEATAVALDLEGIEAMALPGLAMAVVTLPVLVWYFWRRWPTREADIPYLREVG